MYLLDTNACIAVINGKPPLVRNRFEKAVVAEERVFVSSVVEFELWYGVAKSTRPEVNAKILETLLAGPVSVLAFEGEDAKVAGRLRASLEAAGRPVGAYDLLITGQALRHDLKLITANTREFGRIAGLQWEDWGR